MRHVRRPLGGRITDEQVADVGQARSAFGKQYARARMTVPQRILQIAIEATRCLAVGYQLLTRIDPAGDQPRGSGCPGLDARGGRRGDDAASGVA
jgi:hypothetical protein